MVYGRQVPDESERWTIRRHDQADYPRIPVGPLGWSLPERFTRELDHGREPLVLTLECAFGGDRTVVEAVLLRSREDRSVTPRDLSAVELARAVYLVTEACLEPEAAKHLERRHGKVTEKDLPLMASVYAFQHAAWGNPRQAIMNLWGLPRATASRWIRKLREEYPDAMPKDGGDGDGERDKTA